MTEYIQPTLTENEFINVIKHNIDNKKPYCMTRYGDGEIYLLNNNCPPALVDKIKALWKISNFEAFRQYIVDSILLPSIEKSNCIGILSRNNEICNTLRYDEKKWSISKNYIHQIRSDSFSICDHQITRSINFGDVRNFKNILNGKSLNIISPNVQLLNKNLSTLLDADVKITIIDNNRDRLLASLDKIDQDVIIYGASITGKDIGIRMAERGKVCLDFGATLDAWANIQSRPWFKDGGKQSYCVIRD